MFSHKYIVKSFIHFSHMSREVPRVVEYMIALLSYSVFSPVGAHCDPSEVKERKGRSHSESP